MQVYATFLYLSALGGVNALLILILRALLLVNGMPPLLAILLWLQHALGHHPRDEHRNR